MNGEPELEGAFDVKRRRGGQGLSIWVRALGTTLWLAPIRAYRRFISPALPARCKYYPSCSRYAIDAVRELGIVRGSIVAAWRLARCNPWSNGGVDTIEARRLFRERPDAPAGPPRELPS